MRDFQLRINDPKTYKRAIKILSSRHFIEKFLYDMKISTSEFEWLRCKNKSMTGKPLRSIFKVTSGKSPLRKNSNITEYAEDMLPGCSLILTHPLWDILANPQASLGGVRGMMERLPLEIRRNLLIVDPNTKKLTRKPLKGPNDIDRLALRCDMDALAYVLMLIRETEILDMPEAYIRAKRSAINICNILSIDIGFSKTLEELQDHIYIEFIWKNLNLKLHDPEYHRIFKNRMYLPSKINPVQMEKQFQKEIISRLKKIFILAENAKLKDKKKFLYLIYLSGTSGILDQLEKWKDIRKNILKEEKIILPIQLGFLAQDFYNKSLMRPNSGNFHINYYKRLERSNYQIPLNISSLSTNHV